jgi:tetratricopeptide (TPR) repeat protein
MRLIATVSIFLLLTVLSLDSIAAPPAAPFQFLEHPGPYAVGLKVVDQYDYSRVYRYSTDDLGKPYRGERARPLQTLIWYPAEKSDAKPMTVGDYTDLLKTETNFDGSKMPAYAQDIIGLDGFSKSTLATSLWSVRDAPLVSGRFPVVIYAPSGPSVSWENADLCEYLASHGYVVIASPDMGIKTRDITDDVADINSQALDISFLIGYAQTLSNTDMSKVAVASFSWGGIANLFAAARDNRIDALVALDGSMRYYPALVKQAGDVHPEQMTIPLLFFTEGEIPLEDQSSNDHAGPNVLNAWTHGDLFTVDMLALDHIEFSSMYQRTEVTWRDYFTPKADYGREYGAPSFGWIARYTLKFLDAYLKRDTSAMAYLKNTPAQNGVPAHLMAVKYRAAKGIPASFEAFRAELGRQGFDRAADIYASMKKEAPDFDLDQTAVTNWAYRLMTDQHWPEAIDLMKLNTQIHPDSDDAYFNLGEAYRMAGQKQAAVDSYRKALEKGPGNGQAKQALKDLGGNEAASE